MRADLAERLLRQVMGWDTGEFAERVRDLQALAVVKFDEYGNYGPGSKFVENLAMWLDQFPEERRRTAFDFVLTNLVFLSEVEIGHLISLVYPEIIAPVVRARVAADEGIQPHRVAEIERHPHYAELRRRSLVLGASDGARLDKLRRASPLSHEQFFQGARPTIDELEPKVEKLVKALRLPDGETSTFNHIFFVDDFSGSGRTLIREDSDAPGGYDGKLIRLRDSLAAASGAVQDELAEGDKSRILVEAGTPVTIVLYCASEQALAQIRTGIAAAGLGDWKVACVQRLPDSQRVDSAAPDMAILCHDFFDRSTEDSDKGATPVGYSECALPVVLSHNTPNNSVCLLWMDTSERDDGTGLRALFPRYERHHPDRR